MNGDELTRLLQNEVKKTIETAFRKGLHAARPANSRRIINPRKEVIARLIASHPGMTTMDVCRAMDKLQETSPGVSKYRPPHTWPSRLWCDSYNLVRDRVKPFIAKIRHDLARYSLE
jgi:hypothetical protein